jgi:hypothetical protein
MMPRIVTFTIGLRNELFPSTSLLKRSLTPLLNEPEEIIMVGTIALPTIAEHGATRLPSVEVDSYNIELRDDEGFIGDRASKGAFRDFVENWRTPLRKAGNDPLIFYWDNTTRALLF